MSAGFVTTVEDVARIVRYYSTFYVWHGFVVSLLSAEYKPTGHGCQSCSCQLNRNFVPMYLFAPENYVSRDVFGCLVPRYLAHSPH